MREKWKWNEVKEGRNKTEQKFGTYMILLNLASPMPSAPSMDIRQVGRRQFEVKRNTPFQPVGKYSKMPHMEKVH